MFRTLLVLCLVSVAYCQTQCQTCVENKFKEMKSQFEAKKKACFTDNGCTPSFNRTKNGNHSSPGSKEHGSLTDAEQQCINKTLQNAKAAVETCVQSTVPGFKFPSFEGAHHHGFKGRGHFGGGKIGGHSGGGNQEKFGRSKENHWKGKHQGWSKEKSNTWIQNMCQNSNASAIASCLFSHGHQMHEEHGKFDFRALICNVTTNCSKTTGQNCTVEAQSVKKALCNCTGQNHTKPDIRSCFGNTTSTNAPGRKRRHYPVGKGHNAGGVGKEGIFKHFGQAKYGGGVHNMREMFCSETDFCAATHR